MFAKDWSTSQRQYGVRVERDVKITMSDGTRLNADIFRPDAPGRFPAIFSFHPYDLRAQTAPIRPTSITSVTIGGGLEKGNGSLESGDPHFYARRGYVHVIANIRGTGKSEGYYPFLAQPEGQDGCEAIAWIAAQPWCTGKVGMFGVSYLSRIQQFIAPLRPPALKCIFAPWGSTDQYRDALCHGGILNYRWTVAWTTSFSNCRYRSECLQEWGEERYRAAIARALENEDIRAVPELAAALKNPTEGMNAFITDVVINPTFNEFWQKRQLQYGDVDIPAYLGGDWHMYGLHLPAAFRSWENFKGPKKMLLGPPAYLDRPVYQLQYESLRWFDYWLKGIDTRIMDEPPIRIFVPGSGEWQSADEWPLPQTRWTPFYLHENNLLWEREHFPQEGFTTFGDSPWERGSVEFTTPPLVENTEVIGPAVLNLYGSTTDTDVLWIISLREVAPSGEERILTRGWLRGSHRRLDESRSLPWLPYHHHTEAEPLTPGEVYEFKIPLVPTGHLFRAGSRIKIKIACTDDPPQNSMQAIAAGHVRRQAPSRVTVYHCDEYPSHVLLPITRGNIVGTYLSGGKPYI